MFCESYENRNQITFKVKLIDDETYKDIVLEQSDETQIYEVPQLFEQLFSITGIPVNYMTYFMVPGCPASSSATTTVYNPNAGFDKHRQYGSSSCNSLVEELIRNMNLYRSDRFILKFWMKWYPDKHAYIHFLLENHVLVSETECSRVCPFGDSKLVLHKIRDVITDNELHSKIKDLLVAPRYVFYNDVDTEEDRWKEVLMQYNIFQYDLLQCKRFIHPNHGSLYLRNRG